MMRHPAVLDHAVGHHTVNKPRCGIKRFDKIAVLAEYDRHDAGP
jgi:hypothetical protein